MCKSKRGGSGASLRTLTSQQGWSCTCASLKRGQSLSRCPHCHTYVQAKASRKGYRQLLHHYPLSQVPGVHFTLGMRDPPPWALGVGRGAWVWFLSLQCVVGYSCSSSGRVPERPIMGLVSFSSRVNICHLRCPPTVVKYVPAPLWYQ